jgi:hypothetical protein
LVPFAGIFGYKILHAINCAQHEYIKWRLSGSLMGVLKREHAGREPRFKALTHQSKCGHFLDGGHAGGVKLGLLQVGTARGQGSLAKEISNGVRRTGGVFWQRSQAVA